MSHVDDRGWQLVEVARSQRRGYPIDYQPQRSGLEAAGRPAEQRGGLALADDLEPERRVVGGTAALHHPDTDELFLVLQGVLTIQLRDRDGVLREQDVFPVPRGVEHCPRADAEVHALLVETRGTVNTGDAGGPMTSALRELD